MYTVEPVSWSSWGKWSECSRSCNGGIRSRLRTCEGGTTCTGSNYQQESCNTQLCPQAGAEWGQWGSWSGCSLRCGGGRQSRTRQCLNGNICSGTRTQYRDCNEQACPGMLYQAMYMSLSSITQAPTSMVYSMKGVLV